MKYSRSLLLLLLLTSCYTEDDSAPISIDQIFVENPTSKLFVDVIYVVPSEKYNSSMYGLNEAKYIEFLNGCYFNRHNIGLIMGESKTLINNELYDLKDNRKNESTIFNTETKDTYKQDRLNIYIIPRSNTIAIAGIGLPQRALITDEFLHKSTSPHEIGHALGLSHLELEGNIMSQIRPYLRKDFEEHQANDMIEKISNINIGHQDSMMY